MNESKILETIIAVTIDGSEDMQRFYSNKYTIFVKK